MDLPIHPIMEQSFAVIDREIGGHEFERDEYAIVRRVIHSTADFEFKDLVKFSPNAIASGISALLEGVPIVTDVGMVKQGIAGLLSRTFNNQLISAVSQVEEPLPGRTRTETGLLKCYREFPHAIFVIGNAPTALLALCQEVRNADVKPALIIGAPVGFISVVESKTVLVQTSVHQICVEGRKGGSSVAAAIINALITLAWKAKSNSSQIQN